MGKSSYFDKTVKKNHILGHEDLGFLFYLRFVSVKQVLLSSSPQLPLANVFCDTLHQVSERCLGDEPPTWTEPPGCVSGPIDPLPRVEAGGSEGSLGSNPQCEEPEGSKWTIM